MSNNKKINSVQFIDRFLPEVDGVVRVVENYAKIMSKDAKAVVVAPKYYKHKDNYGFDVVRVTSIHSRITDLAIPVRATNRIPKRILKNLDSQIYHAHSPFIVGHFALNEARKKKVPIIATFHSKYKDDFMTFTKSKWITKCMMHYIMKFYNSCDAVWACSQSTANTLRSYGYTKEITIMDNGTDFTYPENVLELKNNVIKTYRIDENNKNILFVGQLIWQKNLKLVFDTLKQLIQDDPTYHLYVVGTSPIERLIKDYVAAIDATSNIHFVGSIRDREILKGFYAACDLFFFPSLYDNSPLVLREAAKMKLPSLLCQGSNASEVVKPDYNGFTEVEDVMKMKSKIETIFANPVLMKEVGENASITIPITWEEIIVRVKNEYEKVIDKYNKEKRINN